MVDQFGLETVAVLVLGQNPSTMAALAAQVATTGTMLANSRADENEADLYGVRYASAAGYDPHGMVSFFQSLLAAQGKTPRLLTWLSDHPATEDRIARVQRYIDESHLGGREVGAANLQPVKRRLHDIAGTPPKPPL
jgi:predicted Zn-dependent protease